MSHEDLGRAVIVQAVLDLRSRRADLNRSGRRFFHSGDFAGWARVAGVQPAAVERILQRLTTEKPPKSPGPGVLVLRLEPDVDADDAEAVEDHAEPEGPPAAFLEAISHADNDPAVAAGVAPPADPMLMIVAPR